MSLIGVTEELLARREEVRKMGPAEKVEQQRARGKMTVRERIAGLFDPGTFEETGILVKSAEMEGPTPADGVVTGFGKIDGRPVAVAAYDFTVLAGSIGEMGERKVTRLRDICMKERFPMVWLIDSAGARIQEIASTRMFAGSGALFYEQIMMSGCVPMVAAMMGPGAAGTAYIPALADFVPMVKGTSSMALGGPPLVKAIVGQEVTEEDLGGSRVHTAVSGVAHLEVPDDTACLAAVRAYLGFFPSHCHEKPPRREVRFGDESRPQLREVLPQHRRMAYDVKKLIRPVLDDEFLFEIQPAFARNIVVGLGRIGGRPAGVVANQPSVLAGALDNDASDKAARFINLCDAFNIPLVFFQDVPGFMVGTHVEHAGIIRHGAKLLYAVSRATVPKLTVVVRKAYGAGYYVMCGRAFGADLIVAWPTAEISLMGPEGAVNIIFRRQIEAAADPEEERAKLVAMFADKIGPYEAGESAMVDDIIDPADTRAVLWRGLERSQNKSVRLPDKKHGVVPV